jgi:hypothetical protein
MDIVVRPDQPAKVSGKGTEDKILVSGEAYTFRGVESLSVEAADPKDLAPAEITDDVFAPGNRPNGTMTAEIAPKMPKPGGDTVLEPGDSPGQLIEVTPEADPARARQAGGPEAEAGLKTPGPQPDNAAVGGEGQTAGATGDPKNTSKASPAAAKK